MLVPNLQKYAILSFNGQIQHRQYGISKLFRTVTWYESMGDGGQLISRIDTINFRDVTCNPCGTTQFIPVDSERRLLNKYHKEAPIKFSWCQLAQTNLNWLDAAVREILDGSQRAIDATIIDSLGSLAYVQKDSMGGIVPVTAEKDGVVTIDASGGKGFTRESLQQIRVAMENNGCSIGMGDDTMITVVLPPQAYAQLINSYGETLVAYNYRDEFINNGISSGSRIIDGMRIVEIPSCMFPKDGAVLVGGAYAKNAIGLTITANNILDYNHAMYEGKRVNYPPGYQYVGAPWITQEALANQCIIVQLRFLVGATRIDPKRVVLIKFRTTI